MRILLCLLTVFVLLPPANAQAEPVTQVQPIIVQTAKYRISSTDIPLYVDSIHTAFAWWYALAPDKVPFSLLPAKEIYVENPYDLQWLGHTLTFENDITEIYIVANGTELLLQDYAGQEAHYYNAIIAVQYSSVGVTATLVHELGHLLYDLPDWYTVQGACFHTDIMCSNVSIAFDTRFIGCNSLKYLGKPCSTAFLPALQTR